VSVPHREPLLQAECLRPRTLPPNQARSRTLHPPGRRAQLHPPSGRQGYSHPLGPRHQARHKDLRHRRLLLHPYLLLVTVAPAQAGVLVTRHRVLNLRLARATKTPSPPQAARTPSKVQAPALAPRLEQNRAAAPVAARLLTRPRPWRRPTNRFPLRSSRLHRLRPVRCNRRLHPSCRPNQLPARTPQPVGPVAPVAPGWAGARELPAAVALWVAGRRPVLPRRVHPHRRCRSLPQARPHPLHPLGPLAVVQEPPQRQPPARAGQEFTRRPRDATMPAR
jgi:hypothetical protein